MRTPGYWNSNNLLSDLLYPLGCLYSLATHLRLKYKRSRNVNRPVICIGNLTAGGTGKTPVSVSIAKLLQNSGKNPFFVTRGYGGALKSVLVDPSHHQAAEVGDEPLLLARQAPTVVNSDRYLGAVLAIQNQAELIIMDDGFQNPGLKKDLSFLVFDGKTGIGNGRCIPSGPLRENISQGLKRADAIIILGNDDHNVASLTGPLPVFRGSVQAVSAVSSASDIIAFAGIGRPQKFYDSLRLQDFNLVKTFDFPDHHRYTKNELENLIHESHYFNAELYTTAKDYVKIPAEYQKHFKVLEIEIKWEEPEKLRKFILNKINL